MLLTLTRSTVPRPRQAFRPSRARNPAPREQGALQQQAGMDRPYSPRLPGHEPDAAVRNRLFRYFRSTVLAAHDDGQ